MYEAKEALKTAAGAVNKVVKLGSRDFMKKANNSMKKLSIKTLSDEDLKNNLLVISKEIRKYDNGKFADLSISEKNIPLYEEAGRLFPEYRTIAEEYLKRASRKTYTVKREFQKAGAMEPEYAADRITQACTFLLDPADVFPTYIEGSIGWRTENEKHYRDLYDSMKNWQEYLVKTALKTGENEEEMEQNKSLSKEEHPADPEKKTEEEDTDSQESLASAFKDVAKKYKEAQENDDIDALNEAYEAFQKTWADMYKKFGDKTEDVISKIMEMLTKDK